jgi:site-specific DNA-methyltransferase (adenine-specific)
LFKKPGNVKKVTPLQKNAAKMTTEEWNTYFTGHWTFPGVKQDKHLAMFPEELPSRIIKMFSFPGENVLDPFAGSGTTAKAARNLGRSSISYEINAHFIPLIEEKLRTSDLLSQTQVVYEPELPTPEQRASRIMELPYQFIDVHKLDKKIDVKKLQYGSRLDSDSVTKREELFSVRKIISSELVQLDNDIIVKLIGIKHDENKSESAKSFLAEKFRGRRVYLKYEASMKHDNENHLLAYLYLDNKTFINAHLLKKKHAHVDESIPFRLLDKFKNLRYGDE